MYTEKEPALLMQILATVIQFGIVGAINALPLALVSALFFGGDIGRDMWLLGGVLVGSWFPMNSLLRAYVHKNTTMNALSTQTNLFLLAISSIPYIFMAPILWAATFTALMIGIAAYIVSGQALLFALSIACVFQMITLYRQSSHAEEFSGFSFHVQNIDLSHMNVTNSEYGQRLSPSEHELDADVIVLNPDSVRKEDS